MISAHENPVFIELLFRMDEFNGQCKDCFLTPLLYQNCFSKFSNYLLW